ncbi:hypothetical protein ACFFRR_009406 [Megaselia abdita]
MKNKFRLGIININDDSEEVEFMHHQHQQQHHQQNSQDHHNHNNQQSETELEFSYDNDEANFDEFITQQFNLITEELNVEDLPQLVESSPSAGMLSSVLGNASSNPDHVNKSMISTPALPVNLVPTSPTKHICPTNSNYNNYSKRNSVNLNNTRGMSGQVQLHSHSQSFDELSTDKFVEDIFEGFNLDDADISEGELWKSLGSFDESGLLNDNSDLLAAPSHANTTLSTTLSSSSPSTPVQTTITSTPVASALEKSGQQKQSDEPPQYPDSTTGHNEYQGMDVIEVDVTTQIPGQLPKLKLKFDGRKFVPLNLADSSSNRIAFEKAFIKLKRNNKDLSGNNESRTGIKTELNKSNEESFIAFKKIKSQQPPFPPSPPPVAKAPLKRPRGRPPKEKDHQKSESAKPKGRPKKQKEQYQSYQQPSTTPPPGQSQKCLQEILRKAKELQRQAEAVLHCDYTTNIKGELSWTSSVAAVPPPTARDLFTYNNQTERRSENDKAKEKQKEQLRNNNYGKGDGVEDIERDFIRSRKRKIQVKAGDEEPSSTKTLYKNCKQISNSLEDRPKEKRGRKRKKISKDDLTEEAVYVKTYNYVSKQNSYKQLPDKSTRSEDVENDQVPLSLLNFSNREQIFNVLPTVPKVDETYQNPFRREWDAQSSWSENKYFFHPPVGLETSHSFKEVRDDILDVQRTNDDQLEEKEEDFEEKLCPLRVTIRLSREEVNKYMKSPDSDSSSSSTCSRSSRSSSSCGSSSSSSTSSHYSCDELSRKSKVSALGKEKITYSLANNFPPVNMKREKLSEERSPIQESTMDFTEKVPQSKIKNRRKSMFMRSSDYEEWKSSTAVNHKLGRPQIRFPEFKHNEAECTSCSSSCDEYSNFNYDGSVKMSPQSTSDSDSRKVSVLSSDENFKNQNGMICCNVPEKKPKKKYSGITNKDINMNHHNIEDEEDPFEENIDFDDIDQQIYRATSIYKHYSKNRRRRHMAKQPQFMKYARHVLKFLEYYNRLQHEQRCN